MNSGTIVKLTNQFREHTKGMLGIVVSKDEHYNGVLLEDGHFVLLNANEPFIKIGYNHEFSRDASVFNKLRESVLRSGRAAFLNEANCSEIDIILTDNAEQKVSFSVGYDNDGNFYQSESIIDGNTKGTHTVNVHIGEIWIDVDGNAWRDLEAGGYIQEFISEVIYGDTPPQEFFNNISEALGSQPAGIVF